MINLISALGGAFIGGLLVHFLAVIRERDTRKRAFKAFIQSLIYELDAFAINIKATIQKGNPAFLYDWQQKAVPSLRVECARIRQDPSTTIIIPHRRQV